MLKKFYILNYHLFDLDDYIISVLKSKKNIKINKKNILLRLNDYLPL